MSTFNSSNSSTRIILIKELKEIFKRLKAHKTAFLFKQSVKDIVAQWPDYAIVISKPIDLTMIDDKLNNSQYNSSNEFKEDIELMLNNCLTYTPDPNHFVHKAALILNDFFNNNFHKTEAKINKQIDKENKKYENNTNNTSSSVTGGNNNDNNGKNNNSKNTHNNNNTNYSYPNPNINTNNNNINTNNLNHNLTNNSTINSSISPFIQIVTNNSEEEKIYTKINSIFSKIQDELKPEKIDSNKFKEFVNSIGKSIVKRNKELEIISDDVYKFINSNLKENADKNNKIAFMKRFRKFIKALKDEQGEEENKFNIKINLNEDEQIKESKRIFSEARKVLSNFIENQKIPEEFREIHEYPLEPEIKKNINEYVEDVRKEFMSYN